MPVQTAIAFRGKSLIDKSDVIVVAVTNAKMHADVIAQYYDRRRAVDQRINDSDTPVVYFEFKPDGSYKGYSFYFASGNGCGYCGGNMGIKSTIKLANGRLAGTLKGTDTDRDFNVTIDLPVASDDHGAPLPPDGGAPGKAYRDYHDALVKRDAKALRPLLSDFRREYFANAIKHGKTDEYMNLLAEGHPDQVGADHQGLQQRQGGRPPDRRRVEHDPAHRRGLARQPGRHLARRRRADRRRHALIPAACRKL